MKNRYSPFSFTLACIALTAWAVPSASAQLADSCGPFGGDDDNDGICDFVELDTYQVTATGTVESTPRLGRDDTSLYVVYSAQVLGSLNLEDGQIYMQRLTDEGAPVGAPVLASDGTGNNLLNDASGSKIVYSAFESVGSNTGVVRLYDTETGVVTDIMPFPEAIVEARISGDAVVWVQGEAGSTWVVYYNLAWLGTGALPIVLAGPSPAATDPEIGTDFVVWQEGEFGSRDVVAFNLNNASFSIVADTELDESEPSVFGDWVAWTREEAESELFSPVSTTWAARFDPDSNTWDAFQVASSGVSDRLPSVAADIVSLESYVDGNFNVFVYRISDAATFRVTNAPSAEFFNNGFENYVTYISNGTGLQDVYVTRFDLPEAEPCWPLGDADGDGVCTADDNCPDDANETQRDSDADGVGDACDPDCSILVTGDRWCPPPPRDDCSASPMRPHGTPLWVLLAVVGLVTRLRRRRV